MSKERLSPELNQTERCTGYEKLFNSSPNILGIKVACGFQEIGDKKYTLYKYILANPSAEEFFSISPVGKTDLELMKDEKVAEQCILTDNRTAAVFEPNKEKQKNIITIEQVGDKFYKTSKFPMLLSDIFPDIDHDEIAIGVNIVDVTEQILKEQEAQKLAFTDGLTGLYNRQFLNKFFDEQQHQHDAGELIKFGLIMLDVDRFKKINDTFGHNVGDRTLKVVANWLEFCTRQDRLQEGKEIKNEDIVIRYGGDEFVIILQNSDEISLQKVVERIERLFEELNGQSVTTCPIDVSLGAININITPTDIFNSDEFIKKADALMYKNKQRKNNGIDKEDYSI
jgi:diguanylate cyclase (GGDEF)-like protein